MNVKMDKEDLSRVRRFDLSVNTLAAPVRMDNGFLRCEGRIAKTGVQLYTGADGKEHRELRLPEDVFDAESLESFEQLPLTNNHPAAMLDTKNTKTHAVGNVGKLRADGEYVIASIMITDAEAIKAAEGGRSQLSNGYTCEMAPRDPSLVKKWGEHDAIQKKIRGNHVALCDAARAGPGARLRLDAGDAVAGEFLASEKPVIGSKPLQEIITMPHALKIDGMQFEVDNANAQAVVDRAIATEKQRADAAESAKTEANKKLTAMIAERDLLRADADKPVECADCGGTGKVDGEKCKSCDGEGKLPFKKDQAEGRKRNMDRQVKARSALIAMAGKHLSTHVKVDELEDVEIKKLVVLEISPHLKDVLEQHKDEDGFVDAAYLLATTNAQKTAPRTVDLVRKTQDPNKKDAARVDHENMDAEEVRDQMLERKRSRNVKSSQA